MWNNQKQQKSFSLMSNLQTYYQFKLDFQKVDQHAGGKWLIHGTKRHKDTQLQSMEWLYWNLGSTKRGENDKWLKEQKIKGAECNIW